MADETRTASVTTPKSQRQGSCIQWKSVAFAAVVLVTMMTVAINTAQLTPTLSNLADTNEMIRQLQATVTGAMEDVSVFWKNSTRVETNDPGGAVNPNVHTKSYGRPLSRHESLVQLTRVTETPTCPSGMKAVEMISNPEADAAVGRKIPKIVHMTGKTKCLTGDFFDAAKKWQFQNHSFYFHDDQALEELFHRDWPMFPQLKNTLLCLNQAGGAAIADLWRYLALYEYGGIYTDMDNYPNTLFNATSVDPNTDAYFLQERGGFLSQYFFAVSPKHPLMFLAVHDVMREMHNMLDTGNFYVPVVSGPGAIKRAFLNFMGLNGTNLDLVAGKYSKPPKGHYEGVGFGNHSVSVVASRHENGAYVIRSAVAGRKKMQGWTRMNITNYQATNKEASGKTCHRLLYDNYYSYPSLEEGNGNGMQNAYRSRRR